MRTHNFFNKLVMTVFLASLLFITSCSDDDAATPEIAFVSLPAAAVDTYTGNLVYTPGNGSGPIVDTNGTASISGSSGNYTISFSSDVPPLTNLRFISKDGAYASVTEDGATIGINIDDNELSIGATIQGNTWAFNGEK